jgi:hypothetical protein
VAAEHIGSVEVFFCWCFALHKPTRGLDLARPRTMPEARRWQARDERFFLNAYKNTKVKPFGAFVWRCTELVIVWLCRKECQDAQGPA